MELSLRLKAIADFIPEESRLADIGTDHAYLLTYLLKHKIVKHAIGGELNQGPYHSAAKSVREAGLSDFIEIRLGNGLEVVEPHEIELVTIAGMGGGTIIDILEARPQVVSSLKRMILQPMIGSETLRKWLTDNHWVIIDEVLVKDEGRIYEIIVSEPDQENRSETIFNEEIDYMVSPILRTKSDPLLSELLDRLIKGHEKICNQLSKSSASESIQKLAQIQKRLQQMRVILCQLNFKQ